MAPAQLRLYPPAKELNHSTYPCQLMKWGVVWGVCVKTFLPVYILVAMPHRKSWEIYYLCSFQDFPKPNILDTNTHDMKTQHTICII